MHNRHVVSSRISVDGDLAAEHEKPPVPWISRRFASTQCVIAVVDLAGEVNARDYLDDDYRRGNPVDNKAEVVST